MMVKILTIMTSYIYGMHVLRRLSFRNSRVISSCMMSSGNDKLQQATKLLENLQNELAELKKLKTEQRIKFLTKENDELRVQVNEALKELIRLETLHGKKQIPVPNQPCVVNGAISDTVKQFTPKPPTEINTTVSTEQIKPAKETKAKKEKPVSNKPSPNVTSEAPIDVGRLDFRIGKIVEIAKHPDADSLYVEKIDCGESNPRTVVSGLVNHISIDEMRNRMVVVLCNLKPVKMRGVTSEAMVMCASSPEKVEVLTPPVGSTPGDLVHCEGFPRNPDAQLNPKKKIFETCAPDLLTNTNKEACYKNIPLVVPGKGNILSQTLVGVNVK